MPWVNRLAWRRCMHGFRLRCRNSYCLYNAPPMTKEAVFMCEPNLATMHSTSRQMCADDYTQYCIHQYAVYSILVCCFSTQWRLALLLHHEVQFGRWCPVSGWCCSCRSSQDCCCHDGAGQHLDTDQMPVDVDQSNMQAVEHCFCLDWTASPPVRHFRPPRDLFGWGSLKWHWFDTKLCQKQSHIHHNFKLEWQGLSGQRLCK